MKRKGLLFTIVSLFVLFLVACSTTQYELTVHTMTGGTVSGTESGVYNAETSVTITATPNEGFTFMGWFMDDKKVSDAATYTFVLNVDTNIYARFQGVTLYNFTVTRTLGGTISGAETGNYAEGTSLTVNALPITGNKFDGWFSNGVLVSAQPIYTFTLNSNLTLNAQFSTTQLPQLPAVTNVAYNANDQKVTWTAVEGATGYLVSAVVFGTQTVSIPAKEVTTTDISVLGLSHEKHEITIIAKGTTGSTLDSSQTKFTLTIAKEKLATVTELAFNKEADLITWKEVENSDGYLVQVKEGSNVLLTSDGEIETSLSTKSLGKGTFTVEVTTYAKTTDVYSSDSDVESLTFTIDSLGVLSNPENLKIDNGYLMWDQSNAQEVVVKLYQLNSDVVVESQPKFFSANQLFLNNLAADGNYTVGIQFKSLRHDTLLSEEVTFNFTLETVLAFTAEQIATFSGEASQNGEHAAASLVTVEQVNFARVVPTADGWGRVASTAFGVNFSKNPIAYVELGTVIGGFHIEMIANGSTMSVLGDTSSQDSRNVSLVKEGLSGPGSVLLRLGVNQAAGVGASEVSVDYKSIKISYVYAYQDPNQISALAPVENIHVNFLGFVTWMPVEHADSYKITVKKGDVTLENDTVIESVQYDGRLLAAGIYSIVVKAHHKGLDLTSDASQEFKLEVTLIHNYTAADIAAFSGDRITAALDPENQNLAILNNEKLTTYGWVFPTTGISMNMDRNPLIITNFHKITDGYFYFGQFEGNGTYPYKSDTPGSFETPFTAIYRANVNVDRQSVPTKDFSGPVTNFKVRPGVMHTGGEKFSQVWIESIRIVYVEAYVDAQQPVEVMPLPAPINLKINSQGQISWDGMMTHPTAPEVKYMLTIVDSSNQEVHVVSSQVGLSFALTQLTLEHNESYTVKVKSLGDKSGTEGQDAWFKESEESTLVFKYVEVLKIDTFEDIIETVVKQDGDFESELTLGENNSLIFTANATGWNRMSFKVDASNLGGEIADGSTVSIIRLGAVAANPNVFYGYFRNDNSNFQNVIGDTSIFTDQTLVHTGWIAPLMLNTPQDGSPFIQYGFGFGGGDNPLRSFEVKEIVIAKYVQQV